MGKRIKDHRIGYHGECLVCGRANDGRVDHTMCTDELEYYERGSDDSNEEIYCDET